MGAIICSALIIRPSCTVKHGIPVEVLPKEKLKRGMSYEETQSVLRDLRPHHRKKKALKRVRIVDGLDIVVNLSKISQTRLSTDQTPEKGISREQARSMLRGLKQYSYKRQKNNDYYFYIYKDQDERSYCLWLVLKDNVVQDCGVMDLGERHEIMYYFHVCYCFGRNTADLLWLEFNENGQLDDWGVIRDCVLQSAYKPEISCKKPSVMRNAGLVDKFVGVIVTE